MTKVFAHRALINSKENSLSGISDCIKLNFNFELDLQIKNEFVYLSHNSNDVGDSFEDACKLIKKTNSSVALHVKEIKAIKKIIQLLYEYSINENCFLFSSSESYTTLKNRTDKYVEIASYVDKKPVNINSKILWCDEDRYFQLK